MKYYIITISIVAILYLCWSFVALSLNPNYWSEVQRVFYVFTAICLAPTITIACIQVDKENKQK